ncbi:cytosine permease (plasmid) [Arsenophonus nasoniae]|uniref:Cytosine permease n=1 Tax=Arsenophonus nasoniae TaxID=638 RepID=D2TVR3_9GAMM|nr:cytosine permease [Arsenophonus nasoniae]QBY46604.1 Cytosine permease [Arsenophonus nasoniae]WGM03666.1 cytosine permease [Arsenophonus nasoniae]WGM08357.1 cytosine permease [Arsenophonus nasoniae]WGM13223.1 cytosine permease [Arsenophonus nasoniae]WGM17858.1 cytosine permease [Arsenophonus nasoniae]
MKISKDEYVFSRLPEEKKVSLFDITIVRIGMATSLAQFMLGATLGHRMTFIEAMIATTLGSLVLVFVSFGLGYAGMKESLSTSVLSKMCGFGKIGSILIGFIISISSLGWFGINISLISQGFVNTVFPNISLGLITVMTGLFFTILVSFGFNGLSITAKLAVPLFLMVILFVSLKEVFFSPINNFNFSHPNGKLLSIGDAATMVAGLFIVGALITPDISRYCKNDKHVFWMIFSSILVGEFFINGIAILVSHALGTDNVVEIMLHSAGFIGLLTIILSAIKVNDTNLYSSSIHISAFLEAITKRKSNYSVVTIILGLFGTLLSVLGILNYFVDFLSMLGVIFPPIAGVMLVDYYILKTSRKILDKTREKGLLPDDSSTPLIGWSAIIACIIGTIVGVVLKFGIPSLNSILVAGLAYWVLMKVKS